MSRGTGLNGIPKHGNFESHPDFAQANSNPSENGRSQPVKRPINMAARKPSQRTCAAFCLHCLDMFHRLRTPAEGLSREQALGTVHTSLASSLPA